MESRSTKRKIKEEFKITDDNFNLIKLIYFEFILFPEIYYDLDACIQSLTIDKRITVDESIFLQQMLYYYVKKYFRMSTHHAFYFFKFYESIKYIELLNTILKENGKTIRFKLF